MQIPWERDLSTVGDEMGVGGCSKGSFSFLFIFVKFSWNVILGIKELG